MFNKKVPLKACNLVESSAGLGASCVLFLFLLDLAPVTELSLRVLMPKTATAKFSTNCGNVFEITHEITLKLHHIDVHICILHNQDELNRRKIINYSRKPIKNFS